MHGDALEMLVAGGEQRHDFVSGIGLDAIQRERRIFATAPAEYDLFLQIEFLSFGLGVRPIQFLVSMKNSALA
jgi:hypothetical protein